MSKPDLNLEKLWKNNCKHNEELNKMNLENKFYYYCYKCNNIILIDGNKFYCTYKLLDEDKTENDNIEFDPVIALHNMLKRQEEQIKDINEKLVLNFSYNEEKEDKQTKLINNNISNNYNNFTPPPKNKKKSKLSKLLYDEEIFEKYSRIRNRILIYIHNLCTKMKYNDSSFYFSLYLLDTYLSRIISDDITDRELFLVVLGFFLISSKYIEDDIFEPELQIFCNFEKSILLSIEEIRASEVQCLALINYNMYIYSVYDWVNVLLSNGFVFEDEINDIDQVDNIYTYTQKLLTNITSKIYFCKYSSIQIAFSIVHLSREQYLNKNIPLSKKLYNLLLDIYNISFSDYEECYNLIKRDIAEEDDISEEDDESSKINLNIQSKKRAKSLEVNLTESNYSTTKTKRDINKIMGDISKNNNKNILSQSSNKYINTDFNLKNNSNAKKTKLYISPGQINLAVHKLKYKSSKSSDKNYELQNNKIVRNFNNNINKKIKGNNNALKTFKNNTLNLQDPKQLMVEYQKIMNSKSKKNNGSGNTLFINYAPKFLIKNTGPNINNLNYINNININNEIINLISKKEREKSKEKKFHKNTKSGLNFNYVYNINNNKESKNKYKLKKSKFNRGNSINSLNYEYIIDNIKNLKINNKIKNINTSQNIVYIKNNNNNSKNKRIDKSQKEKYKTHLILDIPNNITNESNHKIILNTEHNNINKSENKYNNNLNINHNNKSKLKLNLGEKKNIKLLNQNINKNKLNSRKFIINFRDAVNKKVNAERRNNFFSKEKDKDKENNNKRFKNLNKNEYLINNDINKNKNILQNKNYKNKIIYGNLNNNDNNLFQKILKENNNLNFKNIAIIKSKLPKLKINKTGLNNN